MPLTVFGVLRLVALSLLLTTSASGVFRDQAQDVLNLARLLRQDYGQFTYQIEPSYGTGIGEKYPTSRITVRAFSSSLTGAQAMALLSGHTFENRLRQIFALSTIRSINVVFIRTGTPVSKTVADFSMVSPVFEPLSEPFVSTGPFQEDPEYAAYPWNAQVKRVVMAFADQPDFGTAEWCRRALCIDTTRSPAEVLSIWEASVRGVLDQRRVEHSQPGYTTYRYCQGQKLAVSLILDTRLGGTRVYLSNGRGECAGP